MFLTNHHKQQMVSEVLMCIVFVHMLVFGALCVVRIESENSVFFYVRVLENVMGMSMFAMTLCFARTVGSPLVALLAYCANLRHAVTEANKKDESVKEIGAKLLEFMQLAINNERAKGDGASSSDLSAAHTE